MKKIFKFGVKYSIVCLAAITLFFVVALNTRISVSATSGDISNIAVSVGETYETSGINYHCTADNSYVIYGTSADLTDYTKAETTSTIWGMEADPDDAETGFAERYVCKANLTGLSQNTKYYYQIISGSNKSEIKSFRALSKQVSLKEDNKLTSLEDKILFVLYSEYNLLCVLNIFSFISSLLGRIIFPSSLQQGQGLLYKSVSHLRMISPQVLHLINHKELYPIFGFFDVFTLIIFL